MLPQSRWSSNWGAHQPPQYKSHLDAPYLQHSQLPWVGSALNVAEFHGAEQSSNLPHGKIDRRYPQFYFSLCVCVFSPHSNVRVTLSAEEDGTLCLHPFHWVFPVLWMNTGSLISTSEISEHGDPGKRSWEAPAGSVPWSCVRLNATVARGVHRFPYATSHKASPGGAAST